MKKIFIQSFEVGNLKRLRKKTSLPLVQLIDSSAASMVSPSGLAEIATYANAIGPNKNLVTAEVVANAHKLGLQVHPWTFRAEKEFGPDMIAELKRFLQTGIDGFFTDQPDLGRKALAHR
jgi:glycerophosphoryl diester phosphodiesterase